MVLALTAGLTYLIMSGSVAIDPVSLAQYVALLITVVFSPIMRRFICSLI